VDEKNNLQKQIDAMLRDVAKQYRILRIPPIYCDCCRLRIPETKAIAVTLRDLAEKYGSLCDCYDPEAPPEYPKLLREFCSSSLYEVDCHSKPSDPCKESLSGEISSIFNGLVVREGEETIGEDPGKTAKKSRQ
jgi:hypothetical protein